MDPSNDYGNSIIFAKQLQIELVVMFSGLPKFINSWKNDLLVICVTIFNCCSSVSAARSFKRDINNSFVVFSCQSNSGGSLEHERHVTGELSLHLIRRCQTAAGVVFSSPASIIRNVREEKTSSGRFIFRCREGEGEGRPRPIGFRHE